MPYLTLGVTVTISFILGLVLASLMLWLLSGWSAHQARSAVLAFVGAAVIAACFALTAYGLFFSASVVTRPRLPIETMLQYIVVPLFLCCPPAIAFCFSQSLLRWKVGARKIQVVATLSGVGASAIVPFAAIAAGCGLAGVCF